MSLTLTITPSVGSAITYGALGWTRTSNVGRFALDVDPGTGLDDIRRYRPPGVDGNLLVRCGETQRTIKVVVRYIGDTINFAEAAYVTDMNNLRAGKACTLAYSGQSITGCNLDPGSVSRSKPVRNTGYPNHVSALAMVYFDVLMMFIKDAY